MRIGYSDDEERPGQFALWQANCLRSMRGKAGQAALRELEAALLALPTPRLIAHELDNGYDVCAIGALARHKKVVPKADPEFEMEDVGVECGMPKLVAWKVVEMNDIQFEGHYDIRRATRLSDNLGPWVPFTPEERYEKVLAWVRAELSPSPEVREPQGP